MSDDVFAAHRAELSRRSGRQLPCLGETVTALEAARTRPVAEILANAANLLIQPRCGVGDHGEMQALLRYLSTYAQPDILTITVDSYTRLDPFRLVDAVGNLNGYPVITHGAGR